MVENPFIIKAITELRIAAISGYCPSLVACEECGAFEDDIMYFDIRNGSIYCTKCNGDTSNIPINQTLLNSMRHIVFSRFGELYNFEIPEKDAKILSDITEKYIVYQTDRKFKTLEFLRYIPKHLNPNQILE